MRLVDTKAYVARYQSDIEQRMTGGGEAFAVIEEEIEDTDDLTSDQKAALWLFAFSLRDRSQQQRDALAHLAAVSG